MYIATYRNKKDMVILTAKVDIVMEAMLYYTELPTRVVVFIPEVVYNECLPNGTSVGTVVSDEMSVEEMLSKDILVIKTNKDDPLELMTMIDYVTGVENAYAVISKL
jgi:hypothetical protein